LRAGVRVDGTLESGLGRRRGALRAGVGVDGTLESGLGRRGALRAGGGVGGVVELGSGARRRPPLLGLLLVVLSGIAGAVILTLSLLSLRR
jgi:hypothetical protein